MVFSLLFYGRLLSSRMPSTAPTIMIITAITTMPVQRSDVVATPVCTTAVGAGVSGVPAVKPVEADDGQ